MAEKFKVTCSICGKPLPLEECKTDDHGNPVHEECYAAKALWLRTRASFLSKTETPS
jgi:hypothetical protein